MRSFPASFSCIVEPSSASVLLHRDSDLHRFSVWNTNVEHSTQPLKRLAMSQWDVFCSRPLEGNSLAVFHDGRGLTDAEMQAIA
jgi:Phenazine biosynthesis-like protein